MQCFGLFPQHQRVYMRNSFLYSPDFESILNKMAGKPLVSCHILHFSA